MISRVSSDISNLLRFATSLERDLTPFLTNAARLAVIKVKRRVRSGVNADGQRMVSGSSPKTGAYSRDYGRKRAKTGRQVGVVDLDYTSQTIESYDVIETGANYAVGGFTNDRAGNIADYNEQMFGGAYFLSDQEIQEAEADILNSIDGMLND